MKSTNPNCPECQRYVSVTKGTGVDLVTYHVEAMLRDETGLSGWQDITPWPEPNLSGINYWYEHPAGVEAHINIDQDAIDISIYDPDEPEGYATEEEANAAIAEELARLERLRRGEPEAYRVRTTDAAKRRIDRPREGGETRKSITR